MYKYEYIAQPPESGYYWVMIGDGESLGIGDAAHIMEEHNWTELLRQHPGVTFVGPIPFPRTKEMQKIGRGTIKARIDRPVKRM